MSDVTNSDRQGSLESPTPSATPDTPSAELPTPVKRAVLLMLVGAALSALTALISLTLHDHVRAGLEEHGRKHPRDRLTPIEMDQAATTTVIVLVVSASVATVLWLVMAWLNRRGRWWARIASTVLTLFGILQTWSFLTRGHPTTLAFVLELLVLAVGIAATALLWHPDNAAHFTSQPAETTPSSD